MSVSASLGLSLLMRAVKQRPPNPCKILQEIPQARPGPSASCGAVRERSGGARQSFDGRLSMKELTEKTARPGPAGP